MSSPPTWCGRASSTRRRGEPVRSKVQGSSEDRRPDRPSAGTGEALPRDLGRKPPPPRPHSCGAALRSRGPRPSLDPPGIAAPGLPGLLCLHLRDVPTLCLRDLDLTEACGAETCRRGAPMGVHWGRTITRGCWLRP